MAATDRFGTAVGEDPVPTDARYFVVIDSGPHAGLWVFHNARWDGSDFYRIDVTKDAIALNIRATTDFPFETNVKAAAFWVAFPYNGQALINQTYATVDGWNLITTHDEFGDLVVRGAAIEMDGNNQIPYCRFVNTNDGNGNQYRGIMTNMFGSMNAVDSNSSPSWFAGIKNDQFYIGRAPSSGSLVFSQAVTIDSSGLAVLLALAVGNTGLRVIDPTFTWQLTIKPASNLSNNRTLNLATGDSDRTITLSGNPTLNDWFDQSVKQAAKPTFAGATMTAALGLKSYTVSTLPAGAAGDTAFASNCRMFNGAGTQEGAGVGTGGVVSHNGTAWKIAGTNVTAVA